VSSMTSIAYRQNAALVVVDLQDRLVAAMPEKARVFEATALLVRVATIVGVPIIVTRQYPRGLGDLAPEVSALVSEAQSAGADVVQLDKVTFDCFGEEEFGAAVAGTGRSQLIIAGMESHICICQTALAAVRNGFDVHVVADACCSRNSSNHDAALTRIAHSGAVVTTSESVAYELVGAAGTDEFKLLLAAVKEKSV